MLVEGNIQTERYSLTLGILDSDVHTVCPNLVGEAEMEDTQPPVLL